MAKKEPLRIDLSDKTPQDIADFVSALLAARHTLLNKHGLEVCILPKRINERMFIHPSEDCDFTTTTQAW
jgi:hypothetical protein